MKNTFRISKPLFDRLHKHLFPGDGDEHGAVIIAGISETKQETRFLARELILARDGIDYVPGQFGYRALSSDFVARVAQQCARENTCYFAVHCHGGSDSVRFSTTDIRSHKRGYPALLDITHGGPVGGLVFATNAVAGEIWSPEGVSNLDSMTVVGLNSRRLYPSPPRHTSKVAEAFNRQSLMFGSVGQQELKEAKIGIIGLGGVGSLVNEYANRLGVGNVVAIDFDHMEQTNRPRVVGARRRDCIVWFRDSRSKFLRNLGRRLVAKKVRVAERIALEANSEVQFEAISGDITFPENALKLKDADFLFLCADSMQSRLVFNALVHQYLIPGVQIGSKVPVDNQTGDLGNVFSASRFVLPYRRGGCLLCNELIPAARLQDEAVSDTERERQQYVPDAHVEAPSVITLNALGASQATNDFLFHFLGMFDEENAKPGYLLHYPRERVWRPIDCRADRECLHCGTKSNSSLARGDRSSLPCKP